MRREPKTNSLEERIYVRRENDTAVGPWGEDRGDVTCVMAGGGGVAALHTSGPSEWHPLVNAPTISTVATVSDRLERTGERLRAG